MLFIDPGKSYTGEGSSSFEKVEKPVWRPKGRQLNKLRSMIFTKMEKNCKISLSCLPSGLQSRFHAIWSFPLYKISLLKMLICFQTQDGAIWLHLSRCCIISFAFFFMFTGIACVTGLVGCWRASGDYLVNYMSRDDYIYSGDLKSDESKFWIIWNPDFWRSDF